jgi:hypothetical protein
MTDENTPEDGHSSRKDRDGATKPHPKRKAGARPKQGTDLRGSITKLMSQRTRAHHNGKSVVFTKQQLLLLGLYDKACRGDARSAAALIDMVNTFEAMAGIEMPDRRGRPQSDEAIINEFLRRNGATPD